MKTQNLKKMPTLKNDKEAEEFVENSDLTEYDLSQFKPTKFEFEPKATAINMRLPHNLLIAIKSKAKAEGMPYTRYIRLVLEQAVSHT